MRQDLLAALLALAFVSSVTGCRACLDGDDLELHEADGGAGGREPNGSGGAGSPSSSSTEGGPSSGPGAGGASATTSTSTSTSTSTTGSGAGGGTSCDGPIEATIALGTSYLLSTTNAAGPAAEGCSHDGPSRFIRLTPAADGYLSVWIRRDQTNFDSALGLGAACNALDLCANDNQGNGAENVVLAATTGVPIWITVSGSTPSDVGTFGLEATLDAGTCLDPVEMHVAASSTATIARLDSSLLTNHVDSCAGNGGSEIELRVTGVGTNGALVTMYPANFDAVLHARPTCKSPEIDCVNDAGNEVAEQLVLPLDPSAIVFADSTPDGGGLFTLTVFGDP